MRKLPKEKKNQTVGRKDPDLKFDIWSVLFAIIGGVVAWINMLLIYNSPPVFEVLAFLSIILTTIPPGVLIALKNRYWGYGYLLGFSIAGIPFWIFVDPFIGGYTCFTTLSIFVILWLIFWKTWRSLSSIKVVKEE